MVAVTEFGIDIILPAKIAVDTNASDHTVLVVFDSKHGA